MPSLNYEIPEGDAFDQRWIFGSNTDFVKSNKIEIIFEIWYPELPFCSHPRIRKMLSFFCVVWIDMSWVWVNTDTTCGTIKRYI